MQVEQWNARKQRSNSQNANSMTDAVAIPGKFGYAVVILGYRCRMQGGVAAAYVESAVTDSVASSFLIATLNVAAAPGQNVAAAQLVGEHIFSEGKDISITVTGNGTAAGVGYTVDWIYVPVPIGFVGS